MSERTMLTFDQGVRRFSCRVIGVWIDEGHVLLHRGIDDDFWSMPGGRGEMLEFSVDSVRREFQEELGVDVQVERLLWVVENFFNHIERHFHELSFYYKVSTENVLEVQDKSKIHACIEDGSDLIYQWFPLSELERVELYPPFLRTGLQQLPENVQHVMLDEL